MTRTPSQEIAMERRAFIKRSGLLIAVCVAGEHLMMSPADAATQRLPFEYLTAAEAKIVGHLGETIVPGALKAGVVHFVDSQLANDPNDALLIARYFSVPPPYGDFYRAGIGALEASSLKMFGSGFAALPPDKALTMAKALFAGEVAGWSGPPSPLFYLCIRSDAADVTYGTPAGFEALGIPYMAHILPPEGWR